MPNTIPQSWIQLINKLHQTAPWVWCWEIEADLTPAARSVFRLVNYPEPVTITNWVNPLTDDGAGEPQSATFDPFPIDQSELRENSDGDLPTMSLSFDNTSRALTRYFEIGNGFSNRRAVGVLVSVNHLSAHRNFTFRIHNGSLTSRSATLFLEMPNFMQRTIPEDRHDARRCRWLFGAHECGYPVNAAAAFTDCPKTIPACIDRGADELSRGLPVLHPARFGGFPGIPAE